MLDTATSKPGYDEWKQWVGVIIDRLTGVVHVYNKPPYEDVYFRENERQFKVETLVNLLRRFHSLLENNASIVSLDDVEVAERDGEVIACLAPLFDEVLELLPTVSDDMQFLLKSPWFENCTGRVATEIFCGVGKNLNEGIGSGRVEHGRLPEALSLMLEREQLGDQRPLREILPEGNHAARRAALARRRNSSLGSAGRVD